MKGLIEKTKSTDIAVHPITSTLEKTAQPNISPVNSKPTLNSAISTRFPNSANLTVSSNNSKEPSNKFYSEIIKKPLAIDNSWSSTNQKLNPANLTEDYMNYLRSVELSVPVILPSNHKPAGFIESKHLDGAIVGAIIMCVKRGIPIEEAFLSGAFQFGFVGSNATILQMLGKTKYFKKSIMNMVPYISIEPNTPKAIIDKLSKLPAADIMFYYEYLTMLRVNKDLHVKLELYQQNIELNDSPTVQNLTGNACPDFVRNFNPPIGTIITEAYDQKSYASPLKDNNHIRPVSGDLKTKVDEGIKHLQTAIAQWLDTNKDLSKTTMAINLNNALGQLKASYTETTNSSIYCSSYNQLRNIYGEFLIQNRIPMNLVTEVSLQQLPIDPKNSSIYREIFMQMYYSKDSPWIAFANAQVQKTNSKLINYDLIIKAFAEYLANQPV